MRYQCGGRGKMKPIAPGKLRFVFQQNFATGSIDVYFISEGANGSYSIAEPMNPVFVPVDLPNSSRLPTPTFSLHRFAAKEFFPALVEALASSGYRYELSDVGELKATKIHLEDMRQLVFEEYKPIKTKE